MKILVGGSSMPPELQGLLGISQIFLDLGWVDNGRIPYVVVFVFEFRQFDLGFLLTSFWASWLLLFDLSTSSYRNFNAPAALNCLILLLECWWSARFILASCTIRARRID